MARSSTHTHKATDKPDSPGDLTKLERARELQAGMPAEEEIQLPPRDTRKIDKAAARDREDVLRGRRLRETAGRDSDADSEVDSEADSFTRHGRR